MKLVIQITQKPNGQFMGWCPSLPGCVSYGKTHSETQAKMEQAVAGYLASLNVAFSKESLHEMAAV